MNRTLSEQFLNAVIVVTRTSYQLNHLGIQIFKIYHHTRLAFCLFCPLPPLVQISLRAHLLAAVVLFMLHLGQNHA
jgi:hypothetical protein